MSEDYSYEYDFDKFYCYPGSNVLKNKLNIKDRKLFIKAERGITSLRTTQALITPIKGKFDINHLKSIHKFLFGDIYTWAGQIRTVNISKGNLFCQTMYIEQELTRVFNELKAEGYVKNVRDKGLLAGRLSYYLSEINAVHPFREGNGRTQRLFVTYLARSNNWDLQFANISPEEMIDASYNSFLGDYSQMDSLIASCLVPFVR